MEYNESLELEIVSSPPTHIYIKEENVKGKRTNKDFKIGKSFQYHSKLYENRFIVWNADNNILTITELSTDFELLGNKIEIEFQKSQVLFVNIYENENDIQFLVSTSLLIMRFFLHHPKKLRHPNSDNFQYSIFYGINDLSELKQLITPYFNANEITCVNNFLDRTNKNVAYFNYCLSNGGIFTFVLEEFAFTESPSYFEMKEGSVLSKLWSGFISRPRQSDYTNVSILDITYVELSGQIYIASISRDNKLKLWSLKDHSCIISEDLLESVLKSNNSDRTMSTINHNSIISSHKIRSFFNSRTNILHDTVVIYFHITLGHLSYSNWIVLQMLDAHSFQMLANINNAGSNFNLIDFEISHNFMKKDKIGFWSLVSDCSIYKTSSYIMSWTSLFENDVDEIKCRIYNGTNELDLHIEDHQDTQEAIINKIFTPSAFMRLAVVNTLNKYQYLEEELTPKSSIDKLKQNLVLIIEALVEKECNECQEQEDFDVIELNRKQWLNILKEIVDEQDRLMEPLGIIFVAGTVGLNRYGTVSLMRSPNELERIMSSTTITDNLCRFYDPNSVVSGCTLLRYLNDVSRQIQLSKDWPSMEYQIFQLGTKPTDIFASLQFNIPTLITSRIEAHPDIIDNTVRMLENVDFEIGRQLGTEKESCRMSSFSMGLLHYSACQIIRDRICLSISMITLIVPRILNSSHPNHMENLIDRLESAIKSLVSIHWLLTIRQNPSSELTDRQKNQLELLNLLENRCPDLIGTDILCLRVLQSLQNKFKISFNHMNNWQSKMAEQISMITSYLHPKSEMFSLYQICKYFLSYNMPLELIDYLKFLTISEPRWWIGDISFVNAMIGLSYLLLNKPWKAVECITKTICEKDIASSLLPDIIFSEEVSHSVTSLVVLQSKLMLKFIEIISDVNNPEPYMITMAESAIKIINETVIDEEGNDLALETELKFCKSNLMNILFKTLLDIGRYNDARLAIMGNPDPDKQSNCLREFITVLYDNDKLDVLVQFDYDSLSNEFISIVHSRARASDLKSPSSHRSFYNILYSYHCKNRDYKLAATCMLELALRLEEDLRNQGIYMSNHAAVEHLQMQVKAYLTCITVSNLIHAEDQLFVFPSSITKSFTMQDVKSTQPVVTKQINKCDESSESLDMETSQDSMEIDEGTERSIIKLDQIKRQYNLIKIRLKVLRESPESGFIQSGQLTKSLTLTSLLKMGFYWDAIRLCSDFNLGLETVVTTIATRYAQLTKNCLDRPLMKERENIIDSLEEINGKIDFASMGNLQKLLTTFLEEVLTRYDNSPNGDLSIKVCSKLLNSGVGRLPSWLINIVVDKNGAAGALLRLYIANGYLEPSINLVSRILDNQIDNLYLFQEMTTQLPKGSNIKLQQLPWVSYPVIFNLLDILENMAKSDQPGAREFHEILDEKMKLTINLYQQHSTVLAIQSG